jgi:Zinc-binding loop region of homing endonuclease
MMAAKQTAESFWARVKKGRGCWEWQGATGNSGYGNVAWHGNMYVAHRVAAWLSGLISTPQAIESRSTSRRARQFVLHKCDNRLCCNPAHFFVGTLGDNMKDAYRKKRKSSFKGESHANAKLTNEQAAEIRRRYKNGELQTLLAKEYGVSQVTISLIIRGKTYRCHS